MNSSSSDVFCPKYSDRNTDISYCRDLSKIDSLNYRHTIAIRPNFPDAYNNMGAIFKECGCLEQAKAYYKAAINFSCPNDHINAWLNLNDILKKQMNLNNAMTDNEEQ
ncbi:UDP-N-acetylglucosamine--peptide N-acetylglucosaminyltransferase 110 kDa subunit-like [Acyrthosiphon pisum]|uniref:Uncharacterized protein n=1 Tax=Acyrthosiphon pisum TaxID=7029 RepID=A0A8R2AA67_ACYPI|nr:UDP-N-acetylglucosamine--peptide N-acetylglucosaminyltransferase 110 kDa subunit-like [Acyrthosiphon pisum]|eukprot:XP_003243472.1 PREDICTED: UDP-N-acetylglucosamine--peptide N-acetylglucosaminyltransferase 110 kDa subunit-like [Acyrthosiphon pisum]